VISYDEYHYLAPDSVLHIRQSQLPDESFARNIKACFLVEKINNSVILDI